MTGEEADEIIHDYIVSQGAYPSGVGFMGFPKSVCISTNDILCHGVPNSRQFEEGDWVNFDVTCFYEGFYGDTSIMVKFGKVDDEISKMVV
jgi:methionyl aminopeptidase